MQLLASIYRLCLEQVGIIRLDLSVIRFLVYVDQKFSDISKLWTLS
jgi:hypothetical protein